MSRYLAGFLLLSTIGQQVSAGILKVPEEYKTIQSAVDAAQPGDIVMVAPGLYKERIRLKPSIIVKSAGDDAKGALGMKRAEVTILEGDYPDATGPGVAMAEGATLDGFTVTGVGKYDDDLWKMHYATQGNQQPHENIGEPGLAGIAVEGVTYCVVTNNIVHHIGYTGIAIMGIEGKRVSPLIARNFTYRNMGGGIGSMRGSTATISENTCFENFYAGIGHENASPVVADNLCYGNIRAGIGISEGACPVVQGNKCYKNRRAGIGIRTGPETQPIVEGNDCYQNDMAGIGSEEEAAPLIRHNRCHENALAGIGCQDHSRAIIIGNECYENEQSGIGQRGDSHTRLIGNHCHHNKAAGIGFEVSEAGTSTVVNNRVIDNAVVAVGIHSGWTVLLSGNELARKGGLPPLVMVFEGAEAIFTKNTIRGEGVAGIRVAGKVTALENDFEGTALRKVGPPNYAIWALEGAEVTMSRNRVTTWRHALHATGATVTADHNTVKNFHESAFVVSKPAQPANVFGNVAISSDPKAEVVSIDDPAGVVTNNQLLPLPAGER